MIPVKCKNCGKETEITPDRLADYYDAFDGMYFCTNKCYKRYKSKTALTARCYTCGINLYGCKSYLITRIKNAIPHFFCSDECSIAAFGKIRKAVFVTLTCDYCASDFTRTQSSIEIAYKQNQQNFLCSNECSHKMQSKIAEELSRSKRTL